MSRELNGENYNKKNVTDKPVESVDNVHIRNDINECRYFAC
jgi:hypothetical protein